MARSVRQQFLDGDAAQLKQPPDGILDEIVRTGRASGDANRDATAGQPVLTFDFLLCAELGLWSSGGPNICIDGHHQRFTASCTIAFWAAVPCIIVSSAS